MCFRCRKVFKIAYKTERRRLHERLARKAKLAGKEPEPFVEPVHVCPQCAEPMRMTTRRFRAPGMTDSDAWKAVEILSDAGITYNHLSGRLPTTAKCAREFIAALPLRSKGAILARNIRRKFS